MFLAIAATYLPYTFVTAFTPGPNNVVALHAVSYGGWRTGRGVLLGMTAGFATVMVACAVLCYELAAWAPSLAGILKYAGAAYILWLAVHVALSKPGDGENRSLSFWKGFALQFVNAKIILYAITVYTGYVLPTSPDAAALAFHAACITVVGVLGMFTWAFAGSVFQRFIARHARLFNGAMGAILALCAAGLLLS